jgi:hypothetical protein
MNSFDIVRYTPAQLSEWNTFVSKSKNATFLFDRRYMDYHADRFEDYSLMVYYKSELYALLPANRVADTLYSHQGLTYGGLLMTSDSKTAVVRDAFVAMNNFLRQEGISRVIYKPIPWIYASLPSEEDLFALNNVCKAQVSSRDVATVVMLSHRLPLSELRRRCVKKAWKAGVEIREAQDCSVFWPLLEANLKRRYNARPVHSLEEITLLKSRFPLQIRLFVACKDGRVIGGTLLYICARTIKTQYISANEEGRRVGALDLLFTTLLDKCSENGMEYFDFGTSNRPENDDLNDSLIFQKEGFGGRAVCYDTYEYSL